MQRILVTGANKGIGLAIVEAILEQQASAHVLLGSRDRDRGEAARAGLLAKQPEWAARLAVLELDVAREASVAAAAREVAERQGGNLAPLSAIVNNAGVGGEGALRDVLAVNVLGIRHTCEAFLPLLEPAGGRIVNVTSASGPVFVAGCSPERRRFLVDPRIEWSALRSFLDECLAIEGGAKAFAARGLGAGDAYGLSKACANAYTLILAREHPRLVVNACTPGFIETDMTRPFAAGQGKTARQLGMKPPQAGTIAPCFLLFHDDVGSGRFYGSDAQRSPLDRYRAPGAAPYEGP
ncbi:MAG: SDR family NAD(P)-dependent oxidoreductase [Deltaproteobacteria bacterium]